MKVAPHRKRLNLVLKKRALRGIYFRYPDWATLKCSVPGGQTMMYPTWSRHAKIGRYALFVVISDSEDFNLGTVLSLDKVFDTRSKSRRSETAHISFALLPMKTTEAELKVNGEDGEASQMELPLSKGAVGSEDDLFVDDKEAKNPVYRKKVTKILKEMNENIEKTKGRTEFPPTKYILELWYILQELTANQKEVLKPGMFKSVNIEDKVFYLKEVAKARMAFWSRAVEVYPELANKGLSFSIGNGFSIIES